MNQVKLALCVLVLATYFFAPSGVAARSFICNKVSDGFKMANNYDSKMQCIVYVRYETDIECSGAAKDCYSQAASFGYSVGYTPRVSAVMVMGAWGNNKAGHAAIVIELDSNDTSRVKVRDSNWDLDEYTREHWIDTDAKNSDGSNKYGTFNYVYCDKATPNPYRLVGKLAWYPSYKSCANAERWEYYNNGYPNGGMSLNDNSKCYSEQSALANALGSDIWWSVLYGSGDPGREIQVCK